jgi:hypothetical protein
MDTTMKSARIDPTVALLGGAGILLAHLLPLLRPAASASGLVSALVTSLALFVGFAVLAFGLPAALSQRYPNKRARASGP